MGEIRLKAIFLFRACRNKIAIKKLEMGMMISQTIKPPAKMFKLNPRA